MGAFNQVPEVPLRPPTLMSGDKLVPISYSFLSLLHTGEKKEEKLSTNNLETQQAYKGKKPFGEAVF